MRANDDLYIPTKGKQDKTGSFQIVESLYCLQTSWLHRASNNVEHFSLPNDAHNVKNVELLKHFKISKTAPTCFGLQGNHHQGATVST